jgi:hypothetical protein
MAAAAGGGMAIEPNFAGRIEDACLNLVNNGYSADLWTPEFGWDYTEKEAAINPHNPQMLAALQCFIAFFVKPLHRVWVHLAAEMQAGKTGVVNGLVRLILKNSPQLRILPTHIFVVTGMNDNAWKLQTKDRLPSILRNNVYHNKGLGGFAQSIARLAERGELANILVVIDESHLASNTKNRPQTMIYNEVARHCPQHKWADNNIRFLTISATDPAKVLEMREEETAQVVRLETTAAYQSVEKLRDANRIRWLETFKSVLDDTGAAELRRCVLEEFNDGPRYHILRTPHGKADRLVEKLRAMFEDCPVLKFDAEKKQGTGAAAAGGGGGGDSSSTSSNLEDINSILNEAPLQHTFIVLKNMLYAAKTLNDEYVGVLWDRVAGKDDTNLQSLLGRGCGYGKSSRTIVYASKGTVDNYLHFWRELSADTRASTTLQGVQVKDVDRRMAGVTAEMTGGGVEVGTHGGVAHPLRVTGGGGGAAAAGGGGGGEESPKPKREKANEDNFAHSYIEKQSLAEVEHKGKKPQMDAEGFYLTSSTGSPKRMSYMEVIAICSGKKTSNMPWGKMKVGETRNRTYVGYRDVTDPASAVFVKRTLTRLR